MENLTISLPDETEMEPIGTISSIVEQLGIILQSCLFKAVCKHIWCHNDMHFDASSRFKCLKSINRCFAVLARHHAQRT